jgi:heptosyltransferase-2
LGPLEILVRGPNWTGDLVMSTPAFRALRKSFASDRITLQLRPGLEPLMAGSPWFDEILPVTSYQRGPAALWREGRALRSARRYDIGVCLPDSWSSALLMRAAGVRSICGYRRAGRGPLLHRPVDPKPEWGRRRLVARELFALELMKAIDCQPDGTELELFTNAEEEAQADRALAVSEEEARRPLLVLAPGASFGPSKCWPPESFAEVGDAASRAGARVAVVGTLAEAALVRLVCDTMHMPAHDLAGKLDLGGLKALLRRADALVCNDAGARHIAAAFGVPAAVLLGPTSLEKTNLNLSGMRVFEADVPCRPCYKRECPIDHRCLTGIEASGVSAAILPWLQGSPGIELPPLAAP